MAKKTRLADARIQVGEHTVTIDLELEEGSVFAVGRCPICFQRFEESATYRNIEQARTSAKCAVAVELESHMKGQHGIG